MDRGTPSEPTGTQGGRTKRRGPAMGIVAACDLAGASDLASGFVAEGKTVSEVIAALASGRLRPKG